MPRARKTYEDVLAYLQQHWGYQQIDKFEARTREALEYIRRSPAMYERAKQRKYRRCVLTKQTSLFYQINHKKEQIELLLFWDNRRDPSRLDL
jgi:plasmid stabilization system protein ParE